LNIIIALFIFFEKGKIHSVIDYGFKILLFLYEGAHLIELLSFSPGGVPESRIKKWQNSNLICGKSTGGSSGLIR
jgi:hypothetical protein